MPRRLWAVAFRKETSGVMKFAAVLTTLLLLVAPFSAEAQEGEVLTVPEAVEQFGSVLEDEGLTLVVIHLNDKTVEALFSTAPNMRALQLQAKDATMFFMQGTNGTDEVMEPLLDWTVRQRGDELSTRAINISNFEDSSEVPAGERFSGLVVAQRQVDYRNEFTVESGFRVFTFAFSPDQIEMIEGS